MSKQKSKLSVSNLIALVQKKLALEQELANLQKNKNPKSSLKHAKN